MLYRLIGLVLAAIFVSFGLSWYFKIPVLALALRLLLSIKGIKWFMLWQGLRTYLLTKAPIQMLWDLPYRMLTPFARGIGLADLYNRVWHRLVDILWRATLWYQSFPFWARVVLEMSLTTGLVGLMTWNSWFLVLVIFVPSEVTRGFSLLVSRYLSRKLANTAFLRVYNASIVWFMSTRLGHILHWLNEKYEARVGRRMEAVGTEQRRRLEETNAGKTFLLWLDRHFPDPPLALKYEWRSDL